MKSRSFLTFILILSLLVVPCLQVALAASTTSTSSSTSTTSSSTSATSGVSAPPRSERLDIYVAGSSDFWLTSLNPVNATKAGVVAAEGVSGVNAYELMAIKTTSASASSELFWGDGYNILRLGQAIPDSGVFLNITASSQSAAQSAASDFGIYLGANFEQEASSGGNYTFFSPSDFTVAGEIILTSLPTTDQGLAGLWSGPTVASETTPTAILTGVRSGSSFTHTLAYGSTETGAVASNGALSLAKAVNQATDNFTAAPNAISTKVVIHSLDGLISSTDKATISNHQANFSGTYAFSVPAGTKFKPNVTLLQDPPALTATRIVDTGSANQGGLVSVTLVLRNSGTTGTLQNINMNDNWWTAYPSLFSLSAGNSTVNVPSLAAGQNVSRVYVLKVGSNASQDLTVPAAPVTYSYGVGNVTVAASTKTNQLELRTNDPGAALTITATTDVSSGSPIGKAGHYLVTVRNTGSGPALGLKVLNYTNPTLPQGGATWTFNMSLPLNGLIDRNFTQTFTVSWTTVDGTKGTIVSNPDTVILSHNGILLPLMQFNVAATLSPGVLASGKINATYTLTNVGNAAATKTSVTQTFPPGLVCNGVRNGTATCTASSLALNATSVAPSASVSGVIRMTFSHGNYVGEPGLITTNDSALTLHTAGAAFVVPAGVVVARVDAPNPVFQGENDTVVMQVSNEGTLPVYNVTLLTQADAFDTPISGTLHAEYPTLGPNTTQSFNYTVGVVTPGNHTTSSVSLSFAFAGFGAQYTVFPGTVLVYKDLRATTSTTPSTPTEGADFSLGVSVQNPSTANVTNVSLSIPIPQGLTILNASSGIAVQGRTISLTFPSLAAGVTSTRQLTLRSQADGSFNLGTGTMTFVYAGKTVKGIVSTPPIVVGVDLLLRYELPIAVAVVMTIAVAVYMHRKLAVPQIK